MSISLMVAVWDLDMDSTEKMVLMSLCDHASDEGVCWPSVATIARKCSKSERTVQAALKWLYDNKYFTFSDRPGKGRLYRLNPRKICTPAKSAPVQKTTDTPAESAPHPRRICTQTLNEPSGTLNDVADATSEPAGEKPKRAVKVAMTADWQPAPLPSEYQQMVDLWPPGLFGAEIADFREYWIKDGEKRPGWDKTFRNRIKTVHPRMMREARNGNYRQTSGRMPSGAGAGPDRRTGFEKAADRRGYGAGPERASGETGRSDFGDGGGDGQFPLAGPRSLP